MRLGYGLYTRGRNLGSILTKDDTSSGGTFNLLVSAYRGIFAGGQPTGT